MPGMRGCGRGRGRRGRRGSFCVVDGLYECCEGDVDLAPAGLFADPYGFVAWCHSLGGFAFGDEGEDGGAEAVFKFVAACTGFCGGASVDHVDDDSSHREVPDSLDMPPFPAFDDDIEERVHGLDREVGGLCDDVEAVGRDHCVAGEGAEVWWGVDNDGVVVVSYGVEERA